MAIGQRDIIVHYQENSDLVDGLLGQWNALAADATRTLEQVSADLGKARVDLGAAYLVELAPEALQRAERLTGFRGFTRRDPLTAMDRERVVLQNTIRQIEADARFVRRQYLVGPQGEHTRELAEARGLLEPWEEECARFEKLDGFLELVDVGYDTPEFAEWWYEPRYWKHWAAGDRICKELGMADFGDDVLPAYHEVRKPRDDWRAQVAAIQAKIDAVHELVRRRDQSEARIPQLPAIYLKSCQEQLGGFFAQADLGLLEEWLEGAGGDRGVQQVLRRVAGLAAKEKFLQEILEGVDRELQALRARRAKFQRKAAKYQRPKYSGARFRDADLDRGFRQKAAAYRAQPDKLRDQVQRIDRFDDYGAFDLSNDPELWWVTMTRKRPSRYTPQLQGWYERHPNAAPVLDEDDGADAAAVLLAAQQLDRTDRGYLS